MYMKGMAPALLILGGILILSIKRGIENLTVSVVDFKINEAKTNLTRIVTDLKLEVLNPDRISGKIDFVFLTVKDAQGQIIATFEGGEDIVFNKQTRFFLSLQAEIKTGRIVAELIEYFGEGNNSYPVVISGYVSTNLGRINFNENRLLA